MSIVLVVDDELAIAESLALILEDEGYDVFCASNGRQALDRIAQIVPDVVVLDFVMPIMTGAELGRTLRERYPDRAIRIVMNSSIDERTVRQVFDGYDVFLRKPYTMMQLLDVLSRLLPASE